jgi:hypothetical protein
MDHNVGSIRIREHSCRCWLVTPIDR